MAPDLRRARCELSLAEWLPVVGSGTSLGDRFDAVSRLEELTGRSVDLAILTHPDGDHICIHRLGDRGGRGLPAAKDSDIELLDHGPHAASH